MPAIQLVLSLKGLPECVTWCGDAGSRPLPKPCKILKFPPLRGILRWDGPLELERKSQEEGREERSSKRRKEKVRQKKHRERKKMGTEKRKPRENAGGI